MRGREPLILWALFGIVAVEILVTYSRVPAEELYRVSGTGFEAGLSRVLVFLNFPVALVAIAILAVSYERLQRRARAVAVAAALLCAPVFWPGVVSQANLDARWVNVIAGVGVYLALLVTVTTARAQNDPRGDRLRIAVAVFCLLAAPAWLAADLGFFLPGHLYRTGPAYVHHGHHHGMDGVLLVLSALLLSRQLSSIRARGLRLTTTAYLALMFAYGLGNIANDFWLEQVVKRGWTKWQVPSMLEPALTWAWAVLVGVAVVIWLVVSRAQLREDVGHLERASDGV